MDQAPSWSKYFMDIARTVASRSKDVNTKVGAVIIDKRKRIIATGYNGFAPGILETAERWSKAEKGFWVVHAEASAISYGGNELVGGTLYVTLHPCPECAKLIISAGIKTVVYETYRDAYGLAADMMKEAGVTLTQLEK